MGLFTNRKKEDDLEGLSEAASMLAQLNTPPEPDAPADIDVPVEPELSYFAPVDETTTAPIGDLASGASVDVVPAPPIAEVPAFTPFSFSAPTEEPGPRRRLEDQPRAQAGNVEIDARGLLDLLGVDADAGLIDISEAHQRFLADHQPVDTDDADAAGIKQKIRCEVNTAYASFRLTRTA